MDQIIKLNPEEQKRYIALREYVDHKLDRLQTARKLGLTVRQVTRLKKAYLKDGKVVFTHKLRGRLSEKRTESFIEDRIVKYYKEDYFDFSFTHFCDYTRDNGLLYKMTAGVDLSNRTVARILTRHGVISPFANRANRCKSQHPIRERRWTFGELVQLDGSVHDWFSNSTKVTLHLAIDDATSKILGGYFCKEETLHGYFQLFKQILLSYGVPRTFYTDRRTVFDYKRDQAALCKNIQFKRVCHELGVDIISTSVAQAKGKVERSFKTHQQHLVSEFRINKITTIEQANDYLQNYIERHNKKYAVEPIDTKLTSFRSLDGFSAINSGIDRLLCTATTRSILNGNVVSFMNKQYMPMNKQDSKPESNLEPLRLPVDTKVQVIQTLDNRLLIVFDGKDYTTKLFVNGKSTTHTPPSTHPWKKWQG